jgi:hypothetical protein
MSEGAKKARGVDLDRVAGAVVQVFAAWRDAKQAIGSFVPDLEAMR